MRYLVIIGTISGIISLSLHRVSYAADPLTLHEYLEEQVSVINGAMDEIDRSDNTNSSDSRHWFFRRFWFRARPNVTFTAGIAKIAIVPELELLIQRPLPEGMVLYHP